MLLPLLITSYHTFKTNLLVPAVLGSEKKRLGGKKPVVTDSCSSKVKDYNSWSTVGHG